MELSIPNSDIARGLVDGFNFTKRLDPDYPDSLVVLRVVCRNSLQLISQLEGTPGLVTPLSKAIEECVPILERVLEQVSTYQYGQKPDPGVVDALKSEVLKGLQCFHDIIEGNQ